MDRSTISSPSLTSLTRAEAEQLEDQWNQVFWNIHSKDMQSHHSVLYTAPGRALEISISNIGLTLSGQDRGESSKAISGDSEYEFFYSLNPESTHRFLTQLRIKDGIKAPLEMILQKNFGTNDGTARFTSFCKNIGVEYTFFSC